MRFLIDENVRGEVVDFLKSIGCDVLLPAPGSKDEEIARIAKETNRTILTHDQHFANILMYPSEEYPGIIRIKINPPSATVIITALKDLFVKLNHFDKRLIILEKTGFRAR